MVVVGSSIKQCAGKLGDLGNCRSHDDWCCCCTELFNRLPMLSWFLGGVVVLCCLGRASVYFDSMNILDVLSLLT